MQIKTIFLDVDEVLAKWVEAALQAIDGFDGQPGTPCLHPDAVFAAWNALTPRPWDVCEVIPHTREQLWAAIHARGPFFWEELELFPWAMKLYQRCSAVAPVVLLTSPSRDPSSFSGKSAWIRYHFPGCDFLIGSCKHRVAHPGAVLIDDSPKNCKAFRKAGGRAIVFPSVGNELHAMPGEERVDYTLCRLSEAQPFDAPDELTPEQAAGAWNRATPAARAQWLRDEIDVVALYRSGDA